MRIAAIFMLALVTTVACAAQPRLTTSPSGNGTHTAETPPVAVGTPALVPLLVSSEITKGQNRFLFSLTDAHNKLVAAPDVPVHVAFYDVAAAPDTVVFEQDARFIWAIEGVQGLYAADATFPSAGRWATRFDARFPDGTVKSVRAEYDVREMGTTPAIGAKAPAVETPTTADVGGDIAQISSDKNPDPRFYETSIAEAIAARKPFVVTFATPAFCQTRLCGPTLEIVKSVANGYRDITFINVEPYRMEYASGALQPVLDAQGQLQPTPWTEAWGLQSEPYTFVVDAAGNVAAKFEGVLAASELKAALDEL